MRTHLRVGATTWSELRQHLLSSGKERMAYLFARTSRWTDPWQQDQLDLLVTRALVVPDAALRVQTGVRVEIADEFQREVLIACYETGLSLIDVHTHPFSRDVVSFSGFDVDNMRITHEQFLSSMPVDPPRAAGSLVLGHGAVAGAVSGTDSGGPLRALDQLSVLGDHVEEVTLCPPMPASQDR